MLTLTALLLCLPAAPQGDDPITKLLRAESALERLPKREGPKAASPREQLLRAGPAGSSMAEALLLSAQGWARPSAIDLMQQGIALHTGKRHEKVKVQARTTDDIEKFFVHNHDAVRKAVGVGVNFMNTVPRLHGLMDRILAAEPGVAWSEDDRKLLEEQLELAGKVDVQALHRAALAVVAMASEIDAHKAMLRKHKTEDPRRDVVGKILFDKEFAFGRIVVGGAGRNIYDCTQIAVIIDIGGDDEYRGPAGGAHAFRRYSVCIDLEGDDRYDGGSGSLGSATFGLGVCIDLAGNDHYAADARSAGFGTAGVGVFLDAAGGDVLRVGPMSGGVGLCGLGHCFDLDGDDQLYGARSCFGIGLHRGFGSCVDVRGDDWRGLIHSPQHPQLSYGAARGIDAKRPGGIGVWLDLSGKDSYSSSALAFGVGDLGGVGICIDASGDDRYIAGNLSLGAARRGGVGIFLDIAGTDHYLAAESMGVAAAGGTAFFEDRRGADIYELTGLGMGWAEAKGMGFFQDLAGKNRFRYTDRDPGLLTGIRGGVSLFRTLGVGDTFSPASKGPGASGRRVETESSLSLFLNR